MLVCGLQDLSTVRAHWTNGHGDPAARRSLLDLPDIDLPCPLFMILPDKWDSARFTNIFLASGFSCSQTESTPAHLRVTQTVGRFL